MTPKHERNEERLLRKHRVARVKERKAAQKARQARREYVWRDLEKEAA